MSPEIFIEDFERTEKSMKKHLLKKTLCPIAIFIALIMSCTTTGYSPSMNHNVNYSSIIGQVEAEKTYINPLFIGISPEQKREKLNKLLLRKAQHKFGYDVALTNIDYTSTWEDSSLWFYFGLLGYVELATATGQVYYAPITDKDVLRKAENIGSDILIRDLDVSEPNSANGVDFELKIQNIGEQDLKYVILGVEPYNRVNDVVTDSISDESLKKGKITGPIKPNQVQKIGFDTLWYNPTIVRAEIEFIKVIYMDNSEVIFDSKEQINMLVVD